MLTMRRTFIGLAIKGLRFQFYIVSVTLVLESKKKESSRILNLFLPLVAEMSVLIGKVIKFCLTSLSF